jgi:hypothetical protein
MDRENGLLVLGFDFDKPHCWPSDSFANCLRINRICLAAFDIGLHVVRRHQPYIVAELAQSAPLVMRRPAGFHANYARGQSLEERKQLHAFDCLIEDHAAVLGNTVNLKNILGQIEADCLY